MTKYNLNIEWPAVLCPYKSKIESSIKPVVKITPGAGRYMTLWQSKFGGNPYLPKSREIPKCSEGKPMILLVQLNFSEIPHVEPMPEKGILQIFISATSGYYGLDLYNPTEQTHFKVIYYSDILVEPEEIVVDFPERIAYKHTPLKKASSLSFELLYEPVGAVGFQFEELLGLPDVDGLKDDFYEAYFDLFSASGHKIGGYPTFTQWDPRWATSQRVDPHSINDFKELLSSFSQILSLTKAKDEKKERIYEEFEILLLQIDTDDDVGISWGDGGIGNFFIREEDLRRRDFSNVLYAWDCC